MKKATLFWQTFLSLEKELIDLSRYIFITDEILVNKTGLTSQKCDSQLNTFSPFIADLLVRCCVQIEAVSKELYFENGGCKSRGDRDLFFDEDCLKLIDIKWATHNKVVQVVSPLFNLTKEENYLLKPLKNAHKRSGTFWEKAYQAVKHDRYSSISYGSVKAFLHALAALYLLNIYYRNVRWITSYRSLKNDDFSFGSSIFAVKPPVIQEQMWYRNYPVESDSPFKVTYQDDAYRRIQDIQQQEQNALSNYWKNQPELMEPAFQHQLQLAQKNEAEDPRQRVMYIWELASYRLQKKVPKELPFEEKKAKLLNCEEWNGQVYRSNHHVVAADLTEENIDAVIKEIAVCNGIELESKFKPHEWISIAMNDNICEVSLYEVGMNVAK